MWHTAPSVRFWSASLVLSAVLGALGFPSPARACRPAGESIVEASVPVPGSQFVPTNAVIYVAGKTLVPSELTLETEAGESVPITISPVLPAGYEIRPASNLAPATPYRLMRTNASSTLQTELTFMTDSGPAAPRAPPGAPDLTAAAVLNDVDAPCGGSLRLCLDDSPPQSALIAVSAENTVSEYSGGDLFFASGCRQIWRQDVLGGRSAVDEVCAEDVPYVELRGGDDGVTCADYRATLDGDAPVTDAASTDSGCSIASMPSSQACTRGIAAAALIAALAARRKRAVTPGRRKPSTPRPSRASDASDAVTPSIPSHSLPRATL